MLTLCDMRLTKGELLHVTQTSAVKITSSQYLGGACALCGYNKCVQALQFHHVTGQKDFAISVLGHTKSWKKIEKELKKCELLCANCHAEIHAEKYILV